jgi:hypothetical protein
MRRALLALVITVSLVGGLVVAPSVALPDRANENAADSTNENADDADGHDGDDRGNASENSPEDRGSEGDDGNEADDSRTSGEDGNSSLVLEANGSTPLGGGSLSVDCAGTPLDNACDKNGSLDAGPAAIDYRGNNSADFLDLTGGGGDTVTITVANQSGTFSFDCELTTGTVTNGTACTASGSSPVGGGSVP